MKHRLQPPDRRGAGDRPDSIVGRMRVSGRWPALAMIAAGLLATGCASTDPLLRYHALSALAPTRPIAACDGPVLQIASVRLPAQFDRLEWIRETAAGQFEVSESDHWAAPPATLARQALAENLAARLPAGRTAFPGAAWPVAEERLSVDIVSLTVRAGEASVLLDWSLRTQGTNHGTAASVSGAQWKLNAPAGDPAAALDALLAQLADRLAAAVSCKNLQPQSSRMTRSEEKAASAPSTPLESFDATSQIRVDGVRSGVEP